MNPTSGPQTDFLRCTADVALYGGAAGGGKTWALLAEPLCNAKNPDFGAVIFRRVMPSITNEGGMWDEAGKIYPLLGATSRLNPHRWVFPSGAKVSFSHLQYEADLISWRGAQIPLLIFDQLEEFTAYQFFYLLSRNRSTCGVNPYVRASANPEPGWLADFIAWWIGDDGYPIADRSGIIRHFTRDGGQIAWHDAPVIRDGITVSKSFTFIPAGVRDNPYIANEYMANLDALPLVERERLKMGNWKIKPEAGKVFHRDNFVRVATVPATGIDCRFTDFAATEEKAGRDPDFTASILMRQAGGAFYVVDCQEWREGPAATEDRVKRIVARDRAASGGRQYRLRFAQDPGSAGKMLLARLIREYAGIDVGGKPETGDKLVRARGLAAQVEGRNVYVLDGQPWTDHFIEHMHNQPQGHDDIMDAAVGAFNDLAQPGFALAF